MLSGTGPVIPCRNRQGVPSSSGTRPRPPAPQQAQEFTLRNRTSHSRPETLLGLRPVAHGGRTLNRHKKHLVAEILPDAISLRVLRCFSKLLSPRTTLNATDSISLHEEVTPYRKIALPLTATFEDAVRTALVMLREALAKEQKAGAGWPYSSGRRQHRMRIQAPGGGDISSGQFQSRHT